MTDQFEDPRPALEAGRAPVVKAKIGELNRLYGLIDSNVRGTTQVIGTIFVVLAGAAAGLSFSPVVFALVPPLWSASMLYAQMLDHDAVKWATLARKLEREINEDLRAQVFLFESRLASRATDMDTPDGSEDRGITTPQFIGLTLAIGPA